MQSFWILISALLATLSYALMKLTPQYAFHELFFMRAVFLVIVVFALLLVRRVSLKTTHPFLQAARIFFAIVALNCNIVVTQHIPLSTAQTLAFTSPLFVGVMLVLASLWKKTPVNWAMVGTLLLGFGGVDLMLRPSFADTGFFYPTLGLLAGFSSACGSLILTRLGRGGEPILRTVFYLAMGSLLFSGGVVALYPLSDLKELFLEPILLLMGLCTAGAQLAQTQAWGKGHTLLCENLQFSTIFFGAFLGWLLFAEVLDWVSYVGISIVFTAAILATMIKLQSKRA